MSHHPEEHNAAAREGDELRPAIAEGDGAALAKYLELRRAQLLAFASKRMGPALASRVEPEDILQEACAEAVRSHSPEWPGDLDPFTWLCRLIERRTVDAHRHHFEAAKRAAGKEQPLQRAGADGNEAGMVNLLVNSMTTPSKAFSRNAREARLQAAIATLSDAQQTAIRMKYVENRPSKDIAEVLEKSDAAVRVMLTRTMKQLHEILMAQE